MNKSEFIKASMGFSPGAFKAVSKLAPEIGSAAKGLEHAGMSFAKAPRVNSLTHGLENITQHSGATALNNTTNATRAELSLSRSPIMSNARSGLTNLTQHAGATGFNNTVNGAQTAASNIAKQNIAGANQRLDAYLARQTNPATAVATTEAAGINKRNLSDWWNVNKGHPGTYIGAAGASALPAYLLGNSKGKDTGFEEGSASGEAAAYANARQEAAQTYDNQGFFSRLIGTNPYV